MSSEKTALPNRARILREPGRYAVLLNARAKGWTGTLHHEIQRYVSPQDLYLSDDFRQADRTVDKLLAAGYGAIFTGGGDGTICYLMSAIEQRIRAGSIAREDAPPVGVLRMGTGNAIASFLGAGRVADDLHALRAGAPLVVHEVDMLQGPHILPDDIGLYPFAGIGWDAEVLNGYEWLKDRVHDTAVENYATGMGGYVASLITHTIPKTMRQEPVHVTVTNTGERALRLDLAGNVLKEFENGEVIFDGDISVCAAATIPYWGFKMRIFPRAAQFAGLAHMRCFDGTVPWIVTHLPSFWKGAFRPEDIDDFLIESVRLSVRGRDMPYQVAGDGVGYERDIDWQVAPFPVRLAVPMK
jgi:diacylglycerol kinase family enzyme